MVKLIGMELLKLRRTSLLWVGVAAGMLAILVSFYLAAADRMTQYTVAIFMGNIVSNNQSSLFPFVAVLTVGRMMEWERSSHTLQSILAIPVRFSTLLAAKLSTGVLLTIGYSLLQWILGIACCVLLHLPGVEVGALVQDLLVLVCSNLCVYLAVLPIVVLSSQFAGGYMAGTVFAVFYGFCSIFANGHGFSALFPVSAGTVLLRRDMMQPAVSDIVCAAISLLCMAVLTFVLTVTSRERTREKQPQQRKSVERNRRARRQAIKEKHR